MADHEDASLEEFTRLAETVPPDIRFGTSSWTYPGWTGLIYHHEYPKTGAAARMLDELVTIIRTGQAITTPIGARTNGMIRTESKDWPP